MENNQGTTTLVIKTALPIGRPSLDERSMAEKYAKRVRKGKTARDKARKVREIKESRE